MSTECAGNDAALVPMPIVIGAGPSGTDGATPWDDIASPKFLSSQGESAGDMDAEGPDASLRSPALMTSSSPPVAYASAIGWCIGLTFVWRVRRNVPRYKEFGFHVLVTARTLSGYG